MIRRNVLFTGRVQGVGFRYTTCEVAERYQVAGFVRNLPDGRVELVAEGEPHELDRFLEAVQQRMAGCIRDMQSRDAPATREFAGFNVRF